VEDEDKLLELAADWLRAKIAVTKADLAADEAKVTLAKAHLALAYGYVEAGKLEHVPEELNNMMNLMLVANSSFYELGTSAEEVHMLFMRSLGQIH
jgi:hypothetical protein